MFTSYINIAGCKIKVNTENNKIYNYINIQFERYLKSILKSTDIEINITKRKIILTKDYIQIDDGIYYNRKNKILYQKLKSRSCTTWIEYSYNLTKINIYFNYSTQKNILNKMVNPKFLDKWENCLLDFFQGPFLGILEYFLLKRDNTFIHASSIGYNDKGYLFCGLPQTGKTEIVKLLSENFAVMADDFSIVDDKNVKPYQKCIGVFSKNMDFDKYFHNKTNIEILLEKINTLFFRLFKKFGIESKRVINFNQLFKNEFEKEKIKIESIYFLNRKEKKFKCKIEDVEYYVQLMVEVMKNEFNNLNGFWVILEKCTKISKDKFLKILEEKYKKVFKLNKCATLYIPFVEDKSQFKKETISLLMKILT